MSTPRYRARQWLRRWLAMAGYELHRLPSLTDATGEARPSAGWLVEFIGPSGAGKSTLFSQLALSRHDWMARSEFEHAANLRPELLARPGVPASVYEWLLFAKFEEIRELPIGSAPKTTQARYAFNKLLADLAVRTRPPTRGVVTDDGVCHNFSVQIARFAVFSQGPEVLELERFLAGRALIRLMATPETLMRQLHQRHLAAPGVANDWLGHLGEAKAQELMMAYLQAEQAVAALFERLRLPTLLLSAEAPRAENLQSVERFLVRLIEAPETQCPHSL